jgi:23S rRNA (adenine2503-C2)-methyltransferase
VSDAVRDTLVPINGKWPIAELTACAGYPGAKNSRRITFEYAMLKASTTATPTRAGAAAEPAARQVNLIPFNPWPGAPYECSSTTACTASRIVNDGGPERAHPHAARRDIRAACGGRLRAPACAPRARRCC